MTAPFKPRDYNRDKFEFWFSKEYIDQPHQQESTASERSEEDKEPELELQPEPITTQVAKEQPDDEGLGFFGGFEEPDQKNKKEKVKLLKIPFSIQSQVGAAMRDFEMIKDGDRVLVALSGGKDSLAMVHILKHFQSVAPIKFDIGAVTIDPMVIEYKPQPLIPYMKSINVPYFLESDALVERARQSMQKNSICSFCSRMKRGMIYSCARREGYNVIAMGQHLDDLAESFVMSSFHNG